jgi:hypothetical protein
MSRLLQLDHATSIASASKLGVITYKVFPRRRLQPVFSVSWYMPKLKSTHVSNISKSFSVKLNLEFAKTIVKDDRKVSTSTNNFEAR